MTCDADAAPLIWEAFGDPVHYVEPFAGSLAVLLRRPHVCLYACKTDLPHLRWGHVPDAAGHALVSWCGNHVKSGETRPRVGKEAASATPLAFRDELISIARSVKP